MSQERCQDCGKKHETGGEALACDHRHQIERPKLHGGLHALNQVRGCPLCEEAKQAVEVTR